MDSQSPSIRAWAQRLVALEAANEAGADSSGRESARLFERLRVSLTQFVGPDGFTALMRRALALARAEVPSLQTATVTAEGRVEGIEDRDTAGKPDVEAAIAITANLLALLVTFIGEPLMIRLTRDLWSGGSNGPDDSNGTTAESENLE